MKGLEISGVGSSTNKGINLSQKYLVEFKINNLWH